MLSLQNKNTNHANNHKTLKPLPTLSTINVSEIFHKKFLKNALRAIRKRA